jgi:hypothetical protein
MISNIIIGILCFIIFILLYRIRILKKRTYKNIFWETIWQKINEMLWEDANEKVWSSTRFLTFFTVLLSNLICWGAILFLIIINGTFPDIPESIVYLYLAANGVAGVMKVMQKNSEMKYYNQNNPYYGNLEEDYTNYNNSERNNQ